MTLSISEATAKYTYGTWRKQGGWKPLHVVDAEGCYFTDAQGKKYLDLSAQLMCVNLGHKNQAIIQAIVDQAQKLPYVAPGFATDVRAEISELLLEVLPAGLNKFFYATSGTEANEAAFKIAQMYTGKYKIISRYNSYHGSTPGGISATGDMRRWFHEPAGKLNGVVFAPEVNPYRCPLGTTSPESCGEAHANYLNYMIENEGNVAAVIMEPIVGTNGILIPPDNYLPRVREICDHHGVLLIFDEVMSGWGRTGAMFACDHWKTIPDIMTTAKGISNAYVPLGLTATNGKIADFFEDNFFAHGHTYEAHPLTLAPAIAAIKEIRRLNLIERSKEMGTYMVEQLEGLKAKHPSIGDVRGKGLFIALELTKEAGKNVPTATKIDKAAGKPLLIEKLCGALMGRGVYVLGWVNHLVIAPPLIITKEEIDIAVSQIDEVLSMADEAMDS